jgi:fumarylacetoacetate (FAA) hydrolase family protein
MPISALRAAELLPIDHANATLIGRVWLPGRHPGPTPVLLRDDGVFDLSAIAPTTSQLLNLGNRLARIEAAYSAGLPRIASIDDLAAATASGEDNVLRFLAPCDLHAIKASGVTFVSSMLERVIEEQAQGDPTTAEEIRRAIGAEIGSNLKNIRPGSGEAAKVKESLLRRGLWSQYLEVGIGPDAELFTKAQPMAAVGVGAEVGIHPASRWNNPEPEIVLAANSSGELAGVSIGNDVNLRDFEGRSALLLGRAKDNNASCAIGPFIRLLDANFGIADVRRLTLHITIRGVDGFHAEGRCDLSHISRDPLDVLGQAINRNHQYPDGLMLFLGTQFAPTQDRAEPGQGFTHHVGDEVSIYCDRIGRLVNTVNHTDAIPEWRYGFAELMAHLSRRGLL